MISRVPLAYIPGSELRTPAISHDPSYRRGKLSSPSVGLVRYPRVPINPVFKFLHSFSDRQDT